MSSDRSHDAPDPATGLYGSGWPTSGKQRGIHRFLGALGAGRPPNAKPTTMLRDLFGRGRRRIDPDTARSAEELGVSRRTVQRWRKEGLPAPGRSAKADELRARWADSAQGRSRRLPRAVKARFTSGQPIGGRVRARVTVSNDKRNGQERVFSINLDPHTAAAFYGHVAAGKDEAAYDELHTAISQGFGGSVYVEIEELRFGDGRR